MKKREGLLFVCMGSNSYFVADAQLLISMGAIYILIIFVVMFMNGWEYYKDFNLWTIKNVLFYCIVDFWFIIYNIREKKNFKYCEEIKRQNENILISQICVFFNIFCIF